MPCKGTLVGVVRSIDYATLNEQANGGEHATVAVRPGGDLAKHAATAPWSSPGAGPRPRPRTRAARQLPWLSRPQSSQTVTRTPAERSRPHRSISPPTVSSSAVPPSAQYALTAALASPRIAAIAAAPRDRRHRTAAQLKHARDNRRQRHRPRLRSRSRDAPPSAAGPSGPTGAVPSLGGDSEPCRPAPAVSRPAV